MDDLLAGVVIDATDTLAFPTVLLTDVIPSMTDISEVQVVLAVVRLTMATGSIDQPIEEPTIVRDQSLRRALRVVGSANEPDNRIATGLELAVGRGVLVRFRTIDRTDERVWYAIATPSARQSVERMVAGNAAPPVSLWHTDHAPRVEPERPTVFRLYEQNIGLLSPLIAEQLVKALEKYPREWIEDAIGEAAAYNKRSLRYIQRILQNWATSGRGDQRAESESGYEINRRRS